MDTEDVQLRFNLKARATMLLPIAVLTNALRLGPLAIAGSLSTASFVSQIWGGGLTPSSWEDF